MGLPGPKGDTGPAGLASQSMRINGTLTTDSSSYVDLGGPTVTVNVGPSGLVAYWATASIASTGGGTASIQLNEPGGYAPQMHGSGSPVTYYTLPGSDNGTIIFNGGLSTAYVGPGTQTFSFSYAELGGGAGFFSNVELVVIPL
jgi:hypothetical protein